MQSFSRPQVPDSDFGSNLLFAALLFVGTAAAIVLPLATLCR